MIYKNFKKLILKYFKSIIVMATVLFFLPQLTPMNPLNEFTDTASGL